MVEGNILQLWYNSVVIVCITYCQYFFLKLLDHEVHARDQVPMLMEMDKVDVALDKAVESGDPQLSALT